MMEWLRMVLAVSIICPIAILIFSFFILLKLKFKKIYAIGFAADLTTLVLFISVPLILKSIWEINVFIWVIIIAIMIAMVYTYFEWRKSKEIYIPQILRRIWRLYFVLLMGLYIGLIITGMTVYIIRFMQ